jgi:hypothetical protein
VTADAATVAVIDALERLGIAYMVVGSLASNFHGIPRSTRDADFVVELESSSLSDLATALPSGLRLQPQGSFEAVTGTIRHVISLAGSPFVCELFVCGDDAHDLERLSRRQRVQMLGHTAHVATAEDMVVTKLRWVSLAHRAKDEDDVRNILAVRGQELDWVYIRRWCGVHGTLARLEAIQASVPPRLG